MPLRRTTTRSLVALAAAACLLAGCGSSDSGGSDGQSSGPGGAGGSAAQTINPFADRTGYADPVSKVAQAAKSAAKAGETDKEQVFSRLAEIPQGIWLTPEEYPPGSVAGYVTSIVDGASSAGEVPTFVIYGIPDRDCSGGHSAGGLSADQYGPWVGEIAKAAGAASVPVAAVVEPDALASLLECGDRDQRVSLISDAARRLEKAGITTYLDGGHSHWIDPQKIADLLDAAGVENARGFSTNVSNFQSDADEQAYAEELSSRLGGAHYVIDTGRNGFGATQEWCNPAGRAFGTEPASVSGQGSLDAYLWIKPPGESDGDCNGGPAAGQFWPERTMELATASGW